MKHFFLDRCKTEDPLRKFIDDLEKHVGASQSGESQNNGFNTSSQSDEGFCEEEKRKLAEDVAERNKIR